MYIIVLGVFEGFDVKFILNEIVKIGGFVVYVVCDDKWLVEM